MTKCGSLFKAIDEDADEEVSLLEFCRHWEVVKEQAMHSFLFSVS